MSTFEERLLEHACITHVCSVCGRSFRLEGYLSLDMVTMCKCGQRYVVKHRMRSIRYPDGARISVREGFCLKESND